MKARIANVFSHAVLISWAVLTAYPLIWAVTSSFKDDEEILTDPWGLPSALRWHNWVRAWQTAHIGRYFLNSAVVVVLSLLITMLFGAMAAYVLARYHFKGNRLVYYLFVGGMMFPVFLALVPLFFVVKNLGLLGTLPGLSLVYAAYSLPFTVFFLTAFFRTLPSSVAEAAMMDGASHTRLFFQIMLPMARPGMVSVAIFNVIGSWAQYLLPVVLITDDSKRVLTQGIALININAGYEADWSGLFAAISLSILPMIIVYAIFQRQIQAGLTAGAVK